MKIACWGLGILLVLPLGVAGQQQSTQQSQADPVAEAARRAREQKKDQAKPARVWDNDDIPKTNGVSVVGETSPDVAAAPATGTGNGATPATTPAAAPAAAAENAATISASLATAKEHLKSVQTDLDILKRKYVLDQQMYLSNPQHESNTSGASQLKDEEDQIAAKQQEVADAQAKVNELQAKLTALAPAPLTPNPN